MDVQTRLRGHMRAEMAGTSITEVGEIMERGDQIRQRRRAALVAAPVMALAVVVVGLLAWQPSDRAGLPDVDAVAAEGARLTLDRASIDWEVQPAALGWPRQMVTEDGMLYALSTAPGVRWQDFPAGDLPEAIYASADGRNWTANPVGGSWVTSIDTSDGLLYAVGTAPGTAAGSVTVELGISDDHGASFETATVPFEAGGDGSVHANVVATDAGVTVLASHRAGIDTWSMLPPDVPAEDGVIVDLDRGLAVLPVEIADQVWASCYGADGAECQDMVDEHATAFFIWEELGVDPAQVEDGAVVTRQAFWSDDGRRFEEVPYPFGPGYIQRTVDVGDEAVALVAGRTGTELFASPDGQTWRPIAEDVPTSFVHEIGTTGGQVVMAGQNNDASAFVYRAPSLDGPWEDVGVSDLLDDLAGDDRSQVWLTAAAVGPSGTALHATIERPVGDDLNPIRSMIDRLGGQDQPEQRAAIPQSVILHSADLQAWSAMSTAAIGAWVDTMTMTPDGALLVYGTRHDDTGRAIRQQATARP